MNRPNNKRKKESLERIERVFLEQIQIKELHQITVTDICKLAKINRTTFYANFLDVYDLADKIRQKLEQDVLELYKDERENLYNNNDFLKLFNHIKENQIFYKTYFKLGFDKVNVFMEYDYNQASHYYNEKYVDYHIEFFKAGFNAIIQKWLKNGCIESPEEMFEIIISEYKNKN